MRPTRLLTILGTLLAARPVAAQDADAYLEITVDVRVQNGPHGVSAALLGDPGVLLNVRQFLGLAEIPLSRVEPPVLIGRLIDSDLAVDTDLGVVAAGDSTWLIPPGFAIWIEGELFLHVALLARALGVAIAASPADLLVEVTTAATLPAVQRMARERLPPAAEEAEAYVELLLDVSIQDGPRGIAAAVMDQASVLVAFRQLLALAEVEVDTVGPPRAGATLMAPARRLTLDTDSLHARVGDEVRAITPAEAVWLGGELYVESHLLGQLLGVEVVVSTADLQVRVASAAGLPVVQRMVRERRRSRIAAFPALPTDGVPLVRTHPPVGGAVLDWSLSAQTEDPANGTALGLGLGALVLGGSAVLDYTAAFSELGTADRLTASWIRAFYGRPWLTQLRLGEVQGTGPLPAIVRGAAVTNAPYLRPSAFAVEALSGALAPGWEVELYRDRQLLGWTPVDAQGNYRLQVPTRYGNNPIEVVAYGPHGEVRRLERTFDVAAERLAEGMLEYALSGGTCPFLPCEGQGNADLRWGARRWATVRAGAYGFWRDSIPDLLHPYLATALQPSPALAVLADLVVNARASLEVLFAPMPSFQAGLRHAEYVGDTLQPILRPALEQRRTDGFVFVRPGGLWAPLFGQLDFSRSEGSLSRTVLGGSITSTQFLSARLDAGLRHEREEIGAFRQRRTLLELRALRFYLGSVRWLRGTLFRAELGIMPDSGIDRGSAGISRRLLRDLQVDLLTLWRRQAGVGLEVGITLGLPMLRFYSRNRADPEFGLIGGQTVEGSILADPQGRHVTFADGRSLGRAGITGIVFEDADGNGTRDAGEPVMPGVLVRVGPQFGTSDASGRFVIWDLIPFEPTVLEVDPGTIGDPMLAPAAPRYTFRPDPNTLLPLPIPLVRAGEVAGTVRFAPETAGIAGVRVEVVNVATGQRYETLTYSDGTFYVLGVRPGEYEATVVADDLARLGGTVTPATFTLGRARDAAIVQDVTITVRRAGG